MCIDSMIKPGEVGATDWITAPNLDFNAGFKTARATVREPKHRFWE